MVAWPASYHWSARAQWWCYVTDPAKTPLLTRVRTIEVGWSLGRLALDVGRFWEQPSPSRQNVFNHWAWEWGSPPRGLGNVLTPYDTFNVRVMGFQVRTTAGGNASGGWRDLRLECPLWASTAFAIPPVLWWRRRRGRGGRGFTVEKGVRHPLLVTAWPPSSAPSPSDSHCHLRLVHIMVDQHLAKLR